LRIEDTDRERSKPEYEEDIKKGLEWLGLKWDEFYRQSERTEVYEKYLKQLLRDNKLYYCFCSKEDLDAERQAMFSQGIPPKYSGRCAGLGGKEVNEKLERGEPHVLRFRIPNTVVTIKDIVRGTVKFDTSLVGDIIVAKELNQPLYNFTVVVDDALTEITHIIRAEDHLSNTPKQVLIAEALGLTSPQFAHLPLILNPDRSKMSKRVSDTALSDYIDRGYLNEAVINFLSYLGWHPKEDKEIMTLNELIEEFNLKRVQKGGAVFNSDKLEWLNSYYLAHLGYDDFVRAASGFLPEGWKLNEEIVSSVKSRLKKLSELKDLVDFYFELPDYDKSLLKWKDMDFEKVAHNLKRISEILTDLSPDDFSIESLEAKINEVAGENRGETFWPLRVSLSGKNASPGPVEILVSLGKEESLKRIKVAIEKCGV